MPKDPRHSRVSSSYSRVQRRSGQPFSALFLLRSHTYHPTARFGHTERCKYEINIIIGQRRVAHSSDELDKAKKVPKKTLDPQDDEKLSDICASYAIGYI